MNPEVWFSRGELLLRMRRVVPALTEALFKDITDSLVGQGLLYVQTRRGIHGYAVGRFGLAMLDLRNRRGNA